MIREKLYLINAHPSCFRPGIPAEIIGVESIKPSASLPSRRCYHVLYSDFTEDWVTIDEKENYRIVTLPEIIKKFNL